MGKQRYTLKQNSRIGLTSTVTSDSYEDFKEMFLNNYDSKEVWDELSAQLGRRNKYTTKTMAEFLEKKGVLARRLRLDDELHLSRLLSYLQASQLAPSTHETQEEKIEIPKNDAEVIDVREMHREENITDQEAESHANSEGDELAAAAEEVDIPGNDAEEDEAVEEKFIGKETLDNVANVTEGQDSEPLDHAVPVVLGDLHTHEGKQHPREEVHAQSGTEEASNEDTPRRKDLEELKVASHNLDNIARLSEILSKTENTSRKLKISKTKR
ncbi:hypothetical protein FQA39_LY18365 [Lamprigera yunnana]|nr:hypothetical protein FQA39_LY18365 [Lamprigera yunnana]